MVPRVARQAYRRRSLPGRLRATSYDGLPTSRRVMQSIIMCPAACYYVYESVIVVLLLC